MSTQLPPNIQEKLNRLQQLQNTMQQLTLQKQRLEVELSESEKALKTLEDVTEGSKVYRSSGAILVEKKKDDVIKELTDRREYLDMRSKVLEKQVKNVRERLTSLQESLQKDINTST